MVVQSNNAHSPATLDEHLSSIAEQLESYPSTAPLAVRPRMLRERLEEGRFHLAVLGQFKRGKSTLLNALLGEPFLPMAVVPLTAIPTLIEYGPRREVCVVFQDARVEAMAPEALGHYVTERGNPGNVKAVARVEVRHPAAILAEGVVMIDTPGIGSTLTHNTETTLAFLSEVDAALFLVSADPPLTAVELDFLRTVQPRVARLFFVLNKVDYLTPPERAEALHFLDATLHERAGLDGDLTIFPVSARQALEARLRGDPCGWVSSGLAAVEERLQAFLDNEKPAMLRAAITTKAVEIIHEGLRLIETEHRALTIPLAELQQKHEAFYQALATARHERQRAADLLAGDRARALATLNEQANALRHEARAFLHQVALAAIEEAPDPAAGEELARRRLAEAVESFFDERRKPFSASAAEEVAALLAPHAAQANALVEQLRRHAADLFEIDVAPLSPGEPPARPREPAWVRSSRMSGLSLPVAPSAWERLLPAARRRERIITRLEAVVTELASHNTENLRWAVHQNSEQTFRQFSARLDQRWAETIETTATAIETALARREQRTEEVAPALARLRDVAAGLRAALDALPGDARAEARRSRLGG
ncbi:MAG: dynamin family protein [Ardenticatenaceae bacterium]|nr:dynamin family protein [Ardenticatenaceae bacterium]